MLNPLIVIEWIQLKLVGLTILIVGPHPVYLRPDLSMIKLQMAVSEELPAAHIC